MIEIRPITRLDADDLRRLITGYTSPARYRVHQSETDSLTTFTLELVQLDTPYVKRYEPLDDATAQQYLDISRHDTSLGAYEDDRLIALALAEAQTWNRSLWLQEFHVEEARRGMSIGTRLMDALIEQGQRAGLRAILCETQNTNVPAVRFYRKMGFTLDGLRLSLYTNDDYPDGEIALFMKRVCS